MAKKIGVICILLGTVCLLGSLGFAVHNHLEAKAAEDTSRELLLLVSEAVARHPLPSAPPEDSPLEMPAARLEGYDCIGILSIPVLELELPVLDGWDYDKLKVAPCQYFGSAYGENFVIAAHNYPAHFGRLSQLQPKDLILFQDMAGELHCYEVVLQETLPPTATEEMITSGFDLSLYTCTPGGGSRVTLRCCRRIG